MISKVCYWLLPKINIYSVQVDLTWPFAVKGALITDITIFAQLSQIVI